MEILMSVKKGKEYKVIASEILGCTLASYYNWDNQNRPIIEILERYFSKEDLTEFLETGKMSKLEQEDEKTNLENIMIDNAVYSAKNKYIKLFDDGFFNIARPAKDILKDVIESIDKNDESYTLDNAKQRLIDHIKSLELNWYSLKAKNPKKQELLYHLIEEYFSKIEVYVMIKHREETFSFNGFFGKSKPPK